MVARSGSSQDVRLAFDGDIDAARRTQVEQALNSLLGGTGAVAESWRVVGVPGGAANANYLVIADQDRFVLRIADPNGQRFGIDRACGFAAHRIAAASGVAPELAAAIAPEGHCLTRFVTGTTMTAADLREPAVLSAAGELLARLHGAPARVARWSVLDATRSYLELAEREGLELVPDTPRLREALDRISAVFAALPGSDVLCHNDLVPQNFILRDDGVQLVDWEYGGVARGEYDLGGFAMNAALSPEQVDALLHSYLGRDPGESERARVELARVVAALREYAWAVIADPVLDYDIGHHGVDYLGWGRRHLEIARAALDAPGFERVLAVAAT